MSDNKFVRKRRHGSSYSGFPKLSPLRALERMSVSSISRHSIVRYYWLDSFRLQFGRMQRAPRKVNVPLHGMPFLAICAPGSIMRISSHTFPRLESHHSQLPCLSPGAAELLRESSDKRLL